MSQVSDAAMNMIMKGFCTAHDRSCSCMQRAFVIATKWRDSKELGRGRRPLLQHYFTILIAEKVGVDRPPLSLCSQQGFFVCPERGYQAELCASGSVERTHFPIIDPLGKIMAVDYRSKYKRLKGKLKYLVYVSPPCTVQHFAAAITSSYRFICVPLPKGARMLSRGNEENPEETY